MIIMVEKKYIKIIYNNVYGINFLNCYVKFMVVLYD